MGLQHCHRNAVNVTNNLAMSNLRVYINPIFYDSDIKHIPSNVGRIEKHFTTFNLKKKM